MEAKKRSERMQDSQRYSKPPRLVEGANLEVFNGMRIWTYGPECL